jgi:hypothetical protein
VIRDAARALVLVIAFLFIVAEVQESDDRLLNGVTSETQIP